MFSRVGWNQAINFRTAVMQLIEFPDGVVDRVIGFLDQQSTINLALTNFRFYLPCLRHLYRRIVVADTSAAPSLDNAGEFSSLLATVVYGYKDNSLVANKRMVAARLLVLNTSLDINPALVDYIKEIYISVEPDEAILVQLRCICERNMNLDKWVVRDNLGLQVPNTQLATVWTQYEVDELTATGVYVEDADLHLSELRLSLTTLVVPADNYSNQIESAPLENMKLKKFRWVLTTIDDAATVLTRMHWRTIQELELVVAAPSAEVSDLLDMVPPLPHLHRLAVVQRHSSYDNHVANEQFDLAVLGLVTAIVATLPHLLYVCLVHDVPTLGNFEDGYEGNYLRRKKLLTHEFALVVSVALRPVQLVIPTLLLLLACYDQAMNHMLWNGCHCSHCEENLNNIDKFMLHHRYFNESAGGFKDINTLLIIRLVAEALLRRYVWQPTWLDADRLPLINHLWDWHRTGGKPFRCYEKDIHADGEETDMVDTGRSDGYHCSEWTAASYQHIPLAMAHYLALLVILVVNLERDNAEEENIGKHMNDGGDGEFYVNLGLVQLGGVSFWVGSEVNGTHYFVY